MNQSSASPSAVIASAHRTLTLEIAGLQALMDALDGRFDQAVTLLHKARGRVIVSGMGKSGHIARKIAATLASTGTPAQFVHPAEASHGDLGMITEVDIILALSWSGETPELHDLVAYGRQFYIPLLAVTANPNSALAQSATIVLALPDSEEACPNGLAPTTSTTMQLALGDALAMALLEKNGFTAVHFRDFHPGGRLGASLAPVRGIMHTGEHLPLVEAGLPMQQALITMSAKGFGCLGVTDKTGALTGVVTDGDLRRHMGPDLLKANVGDVMTSSPHTVIPDALAAEAMALMTRLKITSLFVVEDTAPIGLVHIHDFLKLDTQ
ncbi:MAG: KpsF/GutQ family sugar-phosphate isomerase [Parvularculales bacterium]